MPRLLAAPARIPAAGAPPKIIEEHVGRVSTGDMGVSVAHMQAPPGWVEPGQRPTFREITLVLSGRLDVEHEGGVVEVGAGQAVICEPGEWVRYRTPVATVYVAICLPAFSMDGVHRDPDGG